jgi:hypothetical protein
MNKQIEVKILKIRGRSTIMVQDEHPAPQGQIYYHGTGVCTPPPKRSPAQH